MLEVQGLAITQGDFALADVSFSVPTGAYGILMGSSGSGKTTVLECVCGLRRQSAGAITIAGRSVADLPPGARGIGYVPQDRALFPHWKVGDQIAFGLSVRKAPAALITERVHELADLLAIRHLLDRLPDALSGGEAQRVALARALAPSPPLLCLDEPLSALDEERHQETCEMLRRVQQELTLTVLHITHSRREADALADVHFRLVDGAILSESSKGEGGSHGAH